MDEQPVPATGVPDATAGPIPPSEDAVQSVAPPAVEAVPPVAASAEEAVPSAAPPAGEAVSSVAPLAGVAAPSVPAPGAEPVSSVAALAGVAAVPPPAAPSAGPIPPSEDAAPAEPVVMALPEQAPPRRSRGAIVAIWLLSVALVLVIGAGAWLAVQFFAAQEQISDQEQEIEEQRELIDEKESFGMAMTALVQTIEKFDGALTASIIDWSTYEQLAERGWVQRWDAAKVAVLTEKVNAATGELESIWTTAQQELNSNATGTTYEAVIDRLGGGLVRTVLDDEWCGYEDAILGCVGGDDPYLIHFDAAGNTEPYMTDEIRTGIAYHEFAHVLQFTNPGPTDVALEAFDGDWEVMADCFALTYLPGWTLDHRVWTSDYEYWDVNIGYEVYCSEPQRQAVRDWYDQLGVEPRTIGGD